MLKKYPRIIKQELLRELRISKKKGIADTLVTSLMDI